MNKSSHINQRIEQLVNGCGLVFLGVVKLGVDPDFPRFQAWLDRDDQAGMGFLKNHLDLRRDPRGLAENLKTAVVIGLNYYQGDKRWQRTDEPIIAQYARLKDYHKVIRKLGASVLLGLPDVFGRPVNGRITTDSAPLLERSHAARAGRGFIGKNTCYIVPDAGSFFLLGEVLIDVEMDIPEVVTPDPAKRTSEGGCGSCQRCQVHCPTGALDQAWNLDANKCLAYWSIEHRGLIPFQYWKWFRIYLFGCDICQLVCPYNRGAEQTPHADMLRVAAAPDLFQIATMNQQQYEAMFGGTPLTRAKKEGLIRNALIAMKVSQHPRLSEAAQILQSMSALDQMIAGTIDQLKHYQE